VKLTETQSYWLDRLKAHREKRLRYGAPGMPEKTADALIKLGLIRREMQPLCLNPARARYSTFFVIPVANDEEASRA
jgi:hypothetical protein